MKARLLLVAGLGLLALNLVLFCWQWRAHVSDSRGDGDISRTRIEGAAETLFREPSQVAQNRRVPRDVADRSPFAITPRAEFQRVRSHIVPERGDRNPSAAFGPAVESGQADGLSGSATVGKLKIRVCGSDTMVNLAQAWAEAYAKIDWTVWVEVSGGGSGIGIGALFNGASDIANSSRKLDPDEMETAKAKYGAQPREFMVGYDALCIYVHPSNPLNEITLEQLSEIYREGGKIDKWSHVN